MPQIDLPAPLPGDRLHLPESRQANSRWSAVADWIRERRFGLGVSASLHAFLLVAAVLAFPNPVPYRPPAAESISVDILSGQQFAALLPPPPPKVVSPDATQAGLPAVPPSLPELKAQPPALQLHHAPKILSGGALDRVAAESLNALQTNARLEQLCDVEAMEQVNRAPSHFKPERAVAYATADTRVDGNTLIADGAAFLSKGHWYHMAFKCRTTPDGLKVLSFDFAIGAEFTHDDPALPTDADDD